MNKRYRHINSLKILLEEDKSLTEGFSRLGTINLRPQSVEKCKIDLPQELIKYLTRFKTLTEQEQEKEKKKKEKEARAKKGAPEPEKKLFQQKPFEMIEELVNGFFGDAINSPTQFRELQELLSLLFAADIPVVYCDILNTLALRFHKIFTDLGVYDSAKETEKDPEQKQVDLSIINELGYSGRQEIKFMRLDLNKYSQLPLVKNNSFFKTSAGGKFAYSLGLFRHFLGDYKDSNEFKSDLLTEDFNEIQEIFSNLERISPNGLSDVYQDAGIERILNYEKFELFDLNFNKYQGLDEKAGSSGDKKNAIAFKKSIIVDYASFLIVVIEKVFYDNSIKSTIPEEAKIVLDKIKNLSIQKGGDLKRFGIS